MEYTLMAVAALAFSAALCISSKIPKKPALAACAIGLLLQLIFDNMMTAQGLWIFDFSKTLGIAVPIIPLENLLFGAALILASIWSWERGVRI
jgi:lycopene cyclase domain-containing protein